MATGWLLAAAAATATGVAAVHVIGESLAGPTGEVLSAGDIERRLAEAGTPSPPATTSPATATAAPTTNPAGRDVIKRTTAGQVFARCEDSTAVLGTAVPANGYQVREVDRARGAEAEVTFERGGQRVKVKVTCPGGVPRFEVENK